jgi:predicted nuclease of restriction endonuclease-like RecB superfamily
VDRGAYRTREAEWFRERFLALESGWELIEDAEPIDQGGEALVVPDFSFRKGRRVAHLEILGTWRKASIARRMEMMERHGPRNLVLAVSKKLCGDKQAPELDDAIVAFGEVVPAKVVLERIERVATAVR